MFKKTVIVLTIGLLGSMLASCSESGKNIGKYKPVLNSKPKSFITVKGKIKKDIKQSLQLKWHASYFTTNPKCEKVINSFEGVSAPRSKIINYLVKTDQDGNYLIKIPTSHFTPGFCKWKIFQIYYSFMYKNHNYGSPNTSINLSYSQMIQTIRTIDIQAVKVKSKQVINSPSLIIDNWRCAKKCILTTDAKKMKQYSYITNFRG